MARLSKGGGTLILVDTRHVVHVSVTGANCPMNCKHCGGVYLKHMVPVWEMEKYAKEGRKVFLISGGMSRSGEIPFERWRDLLKKLKENYNLRYNFHVGFPEEKDRVADEIADVISVDFFADPDVMEEVYGIRRTPWEQLGVMNSYTKPVVPHITIGVMCGEITHELRAVEMLSQHFDSIVLNVFIPTPGTVYEKCNPPDVNEVKKLFDLAKRAFKVVFLGCMQPKGRYREDLQKNISKFIDGITKPVIGGKRVYDCCAFQVLKEMKR
jgi:uncharacterized radical SAM superfamily protein